MKQPELGRKIAELRQKMNMTQEDLADRSNINVRSIQRIETGAVTPRLSTMKLLAEVLEYDFGDEQEDTTAKLWIMLLHFSCIMPIVVVAVGLWIMKRDEIPEVDIQGRDVINFQISMMIYLFAASFLAIILIGIPILIGLGIYCSIISVINAMKASFGTEYRYPLTIQFLK